MIQPFARVRVASFAIALLFAALAHAAGSDPLPRAQPEEVGLSSERLKQLDPVLKGYVDEGKLAGSVLLVARRGKLVYLQAFGQRDREARAPMLPDSIFRIASQTKALVSVGILMLAEQGKLQLSDPLSKYIPEFKESTVAVPKEGGGYEVVKAKREITIRDLLTHTSGIGYGTGVAADKWKEAGIGGWYFADRKEPIAATVARMAALPNDAQPGEKWVYGYSIDILGVVIERAGGKPLDEFMRTRITEPLKMQDTAFYLPPAKKDRLTVVYSAVESGKLERAPNPGAMLGQGAYLVGPRQSFSGGAGFLSTAGDYARFLQMMLNGGELDGNRLISRKTVELMTSDHLRKIPYQENQDGVGFGLGFSVLKDLGARGQMGSVGEFGWGGAYHSTYWADPREQLIVVYLTQLNPALGLDDFGKVRSLVYQSIVD
jgi:CubicO group peptidase (beta-lactamase class C family)